MSSVLSDKGAFTSGAPSSVLSSRENFMATAGGGSRSTDGDFEDFYFREIGPGSSSGVHVNHEKAQRHAIAYACVNAIAESIGSLPLVLYNRESNGDKRPIPQHPLHGILHDRANTEHTAVEFREIMQSWSSLRGMAFAEIIPGDARQGAVGELIPLFPDDTRPFKQIDASNRARWAVEYHPPDAPSRVLMREELFVVRAHARGRDAFLGVDPITMQRESIGAALATQEYAGRFFANNATPSGILKHPMAFETAEDRDRYLASWERATQGVNRNRTALLERGLEYQAIGLTQEQAQYLETRSAQKLDICSIFRVPPHKVGLLEDAKFKNIEQQAIEWVTDTLMPWLVRWEQAIKRDLISRSNVFAEHNVLGLLRGDIEARFKAYAIARNWGWLSANDVRRLENQNSIGEQGDHYLQPLNMIPAGESGEPSGQGRREPSQEERQAIRMAHKGQIWIPRNISTS